MTEHTSKSLGGIGQWVKRKEDPRFVHGKGKFVEDIYLPGMVYGVFVRSPYAHAKINGINTEAALKVPGVITVVTAEVMVMPRSCSSSMKSIVGPPSLPLTSWIRWIRPA